MTDPAYTAICLIVDRSGSMDLIRSTSQDALNEFIHGQAVQAAESGGRRTIRLVQFDDRYEQVWPSTPAGDCPTYELVPRGMTALWDAIGRGVAEFGAELAALPEDQRPGNVLVAIMTDGAENSSREWSADQVKASIAVQRDRYRWEFLFMGANQDAVLTGQQLSGEQRAAEAGAMTDADFDQLRRDVATLRGQDPPPPAPPSSGAPPALTPTAAEIRAALVQVADHDLTEGNGGEPALVAWGVTALADRLAHLLAARPSPPVEPPAERAGEPDDEEGPGLFARLLVEHGRCTCPVELAGSCVSTGCALCGALPESWPCPTVAHDGYPEPTTSGVAAPPSPCCGGTGMADHAAVPCPDPAGPVPADFGPAPTAAEMEEHFLDANERMGEALVEIGVALGLPKPSAQVRWGAPEILARIRSTSAVCTGCGSHAGEDGR